MLIVSGIIFEKRMNNLTAFFKIKSESFSWKLYQMIRTFLLCCVGRVFFRAESIAAAVNIFKRMVSKFDYWILFDRSLCNYGLMASDWFLLFVCILILIVVSNLQEHFSVRELIKKQNIVFRWILLYGCIFAIVIFGIYGPEYDASSFIYNQF